MMAAPVEQNLISLGELLEGGAVLGREAALAVAGLALDRSWH